MQTRSFPLGTGATVRVERVGGSTQIEGWEKPEVEARGDLAAIESNNEDVKISSIGDLMLKVPKGARLEVGFVGGVLEIRGLDGPVDVSFVGGDLKLKDLTGQVSLHGLVGGSTRMENAVNVSSAAGVPGPFGGGAASWPEAEKIRQIVDAKHRTVERKVLKAERKLERVRLGLRKEAERWKWSGLPHASQDSAGPDQAPSEEERALVLKMLQEKKITAEEADRLLGALEGQS